MSEGYDCSLHEQHARACDVWLAAWEKLKAWLPFTPFDYSLDDPRVYELRDDPHDWIRDVADALEELGRQHEHYRRELVRFCGEVAERIADSDERVKLLVQRATALWMLGERVSAEESARAMAAEFPTRMEPYLVWAAMYSYGPSRDVTRAREILQQGLAVPGFEDRPYVEARLRELQA